MKYSNIKYFCTTNGCGVRTALFVSGCKFHCKGCFNSKAWDFNYGSEFNDSVIDKILDSIDTPYNSGLSILGGEPLNNENRKGVERLIDRFINRFRGTKDIWMWTGYYIKDMDDEQKKIISKVDYVVDGRFEIDKYNDELRFKGSSNQTIWYNKHGKFVKSNMN